MKSVLVIDDDPGLLESIKDILEDNNFEVFTAINGLDGIDFIKQNSPDIILTDIIMPEEDGMGLIRVLNDSDETYNIIAMSGGGRMADQFDYLKLAKSMGASQTLKKPFDDIQLLAAINSFN